METKGLFYFAHKYTAKDVDGNYVQAAESANFAICNFRAGELLKRGYNVYSPISHTHPIHMATPQFLAEHAHEMWYGLDNEIIAKCNFDGIILAPGWEDSKGCIAELQMFKDTKAEASVLYYDEIVGGI